MSIICHATRGRDHGGTCETRTASENGCRERESLSRPRDGSAHTAHHEANGHRGTRTGRLRLRGRNTEAELKAEVGAEVGSIVGWAGSMEVLLLWDMDSRPSASGVS